VEDQEQSHVIFAVSLFFLCSFVSQVIYCKEMELMQQVALALLVAGVVIADIVVASFG
jgi:hypothetical protein